MTQLIYRNYTATYQLLEQQWYATIKPDDSRFLLNGPEVTATLGEGEEGIISRIKAYIDQDIAERTAKSRS